MNRPKRSEDKYWTGTRNFDHISFEQDLEEYIDESVIGRSEQLLAFFKWYCNYKLNTHEGSEEAIIAEWEATTKETNR